MRTEVKAFLEDLEKRIPELLKQPEDWAAILVANLFVDHDIPPGKVLCAFKRAGLSDDPRQLAGFRDKRQELIDALELL